MSILSSLIDFGPYLVGAIAVLVGALGLKRSGRKQAERKIAENDRELAKDIERRADEAVENHSADQRDVNERLRDKGHLRD